MPLFSLLLFLKYAHNEKYLIALTVLLFASSFQRIRPRQNSTAPFKTIKMACVGNSITAGVGASDREKKDMWVF